MHCPFDEILCVEQHKEVEEWVCPTCKWSSLKGLPSKKVEEPVVEDKPVVVTKKGK